MTACGGEIEENIGASNAYLTQAMSCDHLTELLRADARAQLEAMWAHEFGDGESDLGRPVRAEDEQATIGEANGSGGSGGSDFDPAPPRDDGGPAGNGATGGGFDAAESGNGPSGHSTTNNQVRSVDEADIIKTAHDGSLVWLLHKNTLTTLATWPPQSLGLESSVVIDGNPREMFVSHDRAVIFSDVYREEFESRNYGGVGSSTPSGRGDTTEPARPAEPGGTGGWDETGGTGGSGGWDETAGTGGWEDTGGSASGGATSGGEGGDTPDSGGAAGEGGFEGTPPMDEPMPDEGREYWGPNGVQITIVSLVGDAPQVEKTFQVAGHYVSARKHDSTVRAVINESLTGPEFPELPYAYRESNGAAMNLWLAEVNAVIDGSQFSDWILPRFEGTGDSTTQLATRCGDFYAPKPGSTSGGLTSVVTFDLRDPTLGGANILGNSETVYANQDTLVVGQPEWWSGFWDDESNSTILHAFSVSATPATGYVASGRVAGMLNNQFSLDVEGNTIRAATTVDEFESGDRYTQIAVLEIEGDSLEEVGNTGPLAPDESIFAVRYIGDMAYVVTFLQVDPLFAIDLSDPTKPTVLGQLKIPGFSTYMHPLDDTHLLTIGRDENEWMGGVALQIFDVANPLTPKLSHKHVLGEEGSSSAEYEHKSFTFYSRPDGDLLAIPFEGWSYTEVWDENGDYYYEDGGYHSSLELFGVDVADGITPKGGVDHSKYAADTGCGDHYCYGGAFMRRGVFIDNFLYSISHGAVTVHDVTDLADPVAVLPLP